MQRAKWSVAYRSLWQVKTFWFLYSWMHWRGSFEVLLDDFRVLHNTHRIRPNRNQRCPNGRPFFIYSAPQFYGSGNYKVSVSDTYAALAIPYTTPKKTFQCSEEFEKSALQLMVKKTYHFQLISRKLERCTTRCKVLSKACEKKSNIFSGNEGDAKTNF